MEKDGRERQSHQMTRNQGRKKINPIVGDETETGEEGKADLRRGGEEEEEEEFENGRGEERRVDGVEETGADILSLGVLRVLLIHNSPPWQTFIHILTPHGCAQWSSRPSTSRSLSMDTPVAHRSVSPHCRDSPSPDRNPRPLSVHYGSS